MIEQKFFSMLRLEWENYAALFVLLILSSLRVFTKIHEATARRWNWTEAETRVATFNKTIRGWANYFDQGPVIPIYRRIERFTERRLQLWLAGKHKQRGRGYRQYPGKYLYETLGLIKLPMSRADLLRKKACHSE